MKHANLLSSLLITCLVVALTTAGDVPKPTKIFTYPQPVDHFSHLVGPIGDLVFPQRIFEYNKFWNCSSDGSVGPLFVYTGNEGPLESFYDNTGFMFDIAPQFGALIVFIEHRFRIRIT